jgi:hypothetical protein
MGTDAIGKQRDQHEQQAPRELTHPGLVPRQALVADS